MSTAVPPPKAADRDDKIATMMQGVDTIDALPQWYVNYNLDRLLKYATTTDGKSLRDVRLTYSSGTNWLAGTVARLWVNNFVPGSATKVKFILNFQSGTMDYWDVTVDPPQKLSCDISGLQFGFDVDLSAAAVQQDQTLPDEVKKRVVELLTYLGPGAFTIEHLFMDFENAALGQYDPTVTQFPATMPPAATSAFPNYLAAYMALLRLSGGNTLGYAITVSDIADLPATFPPTSLAFVTNQYRGGPDGKTLNPDLDTIQYLLMTGGRQIPGNLRSWWGNFVVPEDKAGGWYGTIATSNELFVKQFLLPRLGPLVLKYWTFNEAKGSLQPDYTVQTGTFTPTSLGGNWVSGTQSGKAHRTNTWSNDDVVYTMSITTDLAVTPGADTIVITRTTDFDIHYTHWYGIEDNALKSEYTISYNVPLTITIKLDGVSDGQLQVSVSSATRQPPDPEQLYADPYGWDISAIDGSRSVWDQVASDMDGAIETMVKLAMPTALLTDIEDSIKNDLNLKPFVFPGNAQLFMANPEFNAAGDLLLGLQYKV